MKKNSSKKSRELSARIFLDKCSRYAVRGDIEKLQNLSTGSKWSKLIATDSSHEICAGATSKGRFDTLKWCVKNGCKLTSNEMFVAVLRGNLRIVKWLVKKNCPRNVDDTKLIIHPLIHHLKQENYCDLVAWNGELKMMKYLYSLGERWTPKGYRSARKNDDKSMILWMTSRTNEADFLNQGEVSSSEEGNQ